jgi:ubiquitin-protein ligase
MAQPRLSRICAEITGLKLLDRDTADPRFRLQKSPFNDDELDNQKQEEYVIIGQIFPKSNIYNERSYSIEMKLTKIFPFIILILTKMVGHNLIVDCETEIYFLGKFSSALLQKSEEWTPTTSLIQVIKDVVDHVDLPNIDYSIRAG